MPDISQTEAVLDICNSKLGNNGWNEHIARSLWLIF